MFNTLRTFFELSEERETLPSSYIYHSRCHIYKCTISSFYCKAFNKAKKKKSRKKMQKFPQQQSATESQLKLSQHSALFGWEMSPFFFISELLLRCCVVLFLCAPQAPLPPPFIISNNIICSSRHLRIIVKYILLQ